MNESSLNGPADAGHDRSDANESLTSPGRKLASMREARGWSIEQVAGQLNLAPRQVLAIEADDYASLPGTAVTRGFIRAYAKLLQVDPAPFLTLVPDANPLRESAAPVRKPLSTEVPKSRFPSMSDRPGVPVGKIVSAVVLVAAVAGGWLFYRSGGMSSVQTSFEKAQEHTSSAVTEPAAPATSGAPSTNADTPSAETPGTVTSTPALPPIAPAPAPSATPATPAGSEAAPLVAPPATAPAAPASNAAPAATPPTAMASATETTADGTAGALVLTLHADSWIELKRPDNTVIVSKIAKAGSRETFQVKGPVTLVVGNASGVEASLRGNPLDLKANKVNNVARLKLN